MPPFDLEELEKAVQEAEESLTKETPAAESKKEEEQPEANDADPRDNAEKPEGDQEKKEGEEGEKKDAADKENKIAERRARKKELERERELRHKAELENARLKGREEVQQKTEKKEDDDPEPDKDLERDAHTDWRLRQLDKRDAEREGRLNAIENERKIEQAQNLWTEIDRKSSEANPVYGASMKFLREGLREGLKKQYPQESTDKIEQAARTVEHQYVAKLAAQELDIENYFIGEAVRQGFNPFEATTKKSAPVDDKPKTDPREVNLHKQNAGSIASVPQGGGKGRMSSADMAKMSTTNDIFVLGKTMTDSDWDDMAREAGRKGARG